MLGAYLYLVSIFIRFYLFAGKSNLVAENNKDFSKCLLRKHVSYHENELVVSFF